MRMQEEYREEEEDYNLLYFTIVLPSYIMIRIIALLVLKTTTANINSKNDV